MVDGVLTSETGNVHRDADVNDSDTRHGPATSIRLRF